MSMEKHIGFYLNDSDFDNDKQNLTPPWVAYVKTPEKGYKVIYSQDLIINETGGYTTEDIIKRLEEVENRHICCTEEEMDAILKASVGEKVKVTDILDDKEHGKIFVTKYITYSPDVFFYIYDMAEIDGEQHIDLTVNNIKQ